MNTARRLLLSPCVNAIAIVSPQTPPQRRGLPPQAANSPSSTPPRRKGQVRSCNCTKFRFGGYGREMSLVKTIRGDSPNVAAVEGGDCGEWTNPQSDLKTDVTSARLKLLRYDVMVPGRGRARRHGADDHRALQSRSSCPSCARTVTRMAQTEPLYPAALSSRRAAA